MPYVSSHNKKSKRESVIYIRERERERETKVVLLPSNYSFYDHILYVFFQIFVFKMKMRKGLLR